MTHESAEPTPGTNVPDSAHASARFVWHPWIGTLGWILGWAAVSISVATVWEFAATGRLVLGSTIARDSFVLLAMALLTIAVFMLDLWSGMWRHANQNYEPGVAKKIIATESIVIIAFLGAYLSFVIWLLRRAWPPLRAWGAGLGIAAAALDHLPALLVWGLLLPICAVALWALPSEWRHLMINYRNAIRQFGFRRSVRGLLLMSYLRLRLPRRDFFLQSPVISWLPPLAICTFLHIAIEQPVLRWLIPGVLWGTYLPMALDMIVPPTWLFLGKSDFQSFAAFDTMRRTWRQHGLTLLDRVGEEGAQFYTAWRQSRPMPSTLFDPSAPRVWSLRTRPQLWEHTVLLLMDYVLVVVVDMRGNSDIVRDELTWLTKPGRIVKAWFLVSDLAQGAALGLEQATFPMRSRLVTEQMLFDAQWSPSGLCVA